MNFLTVQPENIPQALRIHPRWLQWSAELDENGKDKKEPYQVGKKWRAKSNDPKTWSTFDAAVTAMSNGIPRHGIGYVFAKEDAQTFTDISAGAKIDRVTPRERRDAAE